MVIKIPGWLISLLTFPGIILHEWAHKKFCDIVNVKVYKVVYFNLNCIIGNEPAGYVIHERPTAYKQIFLISVGPLIINSLATILLGYLFQILGFNTPETPNSILAIILAWLALSVGMHAFPSDEDMKHILGASKIELAKGGSKLYYLGFPFVWLISLANKLRVIWFDAIYAGLLMMLGIYLASLNISLILFILLVIVILLFVFLFFIKSNLQSSIVKVGIILIVLLNLLYLLSSTNWYKDKVIEFKAKRFITEVRREMKEKSSKGLSTYGVVDDVYERTLKSDPNAKKIVAKVNEILKKEKTQKINEIKKTYKKDFLKAVETALKERGYSSLYQFFANYYKNYLSTNQYREPILKIIVSRLVYDIIHFDEPVFYKAFGNKENNFFDETYFDEINKEELKNFSLTEKNILVYLIAYYVEIKKAVENEDLRTLLEAGFTTKSKKSVDKITLKIKRGIDIIENIDFNKNLESEIKLKEIFNYYKNLGLFKADTAFKVWYLIFYFIHKGEIPSWEDIAIWQLDLFDRARNVEEEAREIANLWYQNGYLKPGKVPYTPEDVMSIIYALNFKKILRFSADTIYGLELPPANASSIQDKKRLRIVEGWVNRVYNGYKLLGEPIPIELRNLYSSFLKYELKPNDEE
jgi:hypothetical protein